MSRFVVPAEARSWVEVEPTSHFPIQNLPFGLAVTPENGEGLVVAIGDQAIDLQGLVAHGLLDEATPFLAYFDELDQGGLSDLRREIYDLLREDNPALRDDKKVRKKVMVPRAELEMMVPISPPAFVDFYSGIHHAENVGRMFRPDQPPLLPNYRWVPIGYNGRASSVVVSGTKIQRPSGQTKAPDADAPAFGPTKELDFELEMGYYIAEGQEHGKRITTSKAEGHILGLVIVNDWSARDVQRWEYQPLGPFLSKSFATTVSPWVVTLDALEPFRIEGMAQDPPPLPHLREHGRPHFDVLLEVWLKTARAKQPQLISRSNMAHLYWSLGQQIAHQTSNGTPIQAGDLYATGTISGPDEGTAGSLLELSWRGQQPLTIDETGETRTFLEDGDTVTIRAYAEGEGFLVGFGDCSGNVTA
ncbi:MAG: fumarylacetoacetase [Fimbriimonadaceae bacterium]|nr:fumarylacetoacetase [Fimbriimonadaceae bacterium]QYK56290.1 MAG: fumarylacetoacetase [Fimbriimonadaceae bacterium]